MYDHYLPVVIAALVVLLLGCINPVVLQSKHAGRPSGQPNYMLLALAALLSGLISCYILSMDGKHEGYGRRSSASRLGY